MSIHAIYRVCIWLPLLVPALLMLVVTTLGLRPGIVYQSLAYSLLYGGAPYTVLAAWATWWVGGRPEPAIRRLMYRAPLLMMGVYAPIALVLGLVVGAIEPFAGVAALGSALILLLGYAYVGLTALLRYSLGPRVA